MERQVCRQVTDVALAQGAGSVLRAVRLFFGVCCYWAGGDDSPSRFVSRPKRLRYKRRINCFSGDRRGASAPGLLEGARWSASFRWLGSTSLARRVGSARASEEQSARRSQVLRSRQRQTLRGSRGDSRPWRSEEHTSELQSPCNLVCRLLLEKKKKKN